MKKILITGAGSYIGTAVERRLTCPETAGAYQVETMDVKGGEWMKKDFSGFDAVIHVAGIAHRRETRENAHLYYEVNRDLAIQAARKAKRERVGQFLLFSTMNVYGKIEGVIREDTRPEPYTSYGKSKLQADRAIGRMNTDTFRVAILRPPMVYGKGCKGNYPKLSRLAKCCPLFPSTDNRRSMIHIDNLAEFTKSVIDGEKQGIFFPQNREYVCTGRLVQTIAEYSGKKVILLRHVANLLMFFGGNTAKKVLGTLIYDIERDRCDTVSFEESIKRTEQ